MRQQEAEQEHASQTARDCTSRRTAHASTENSAAASADNAANSSDGTTSSHTPDSSGASQRSIQPAMPGHSHHDQAQRHGVDPEIGHEPQMVPGRQDDAGVRAELLAEGEIVLAGRSRRSRRDSRAPRRSGCRPAAARSRACRRPAGPAAATSARAAAPPAAVFRSMKRVATPETRNSSASRQGLSTSISGSSAAMRLRALDVPAPGHVEHADVVEDQQPEGADPHPVEVDAPLGRDIRWAVIWFAASWPAPELR